MPEAGTQAGTEWYCPTCDRSYDEDLGQCPRDATELVRITPSPDPLLGRDLDGRYTLNERVGAGGMGSVYRATQHSVGREVAVKVIRQEYSGNPASVKRFFREATLPSKLSQPNIVSVLDFGQTKDGLLYLTMEYLTGRTLHQVLGAEGPFPVRRVVRVAAQICDALEATHGLPIVHRDLKPSNIMLLDRPAGRDLIKLMDFGLAKSLGPDVTHVTRTSALVGTPGYLAPEVAMGADADARSDLYSVGVILYELLTGRLPYQGIGNTTESSPPIGGDVPPAFENVVRRLLARDPDRRFRSAAQLREALVAASEATVSLYTPQERAPSAPREIPSQAATVPDASLPFASTVASPAPITPVPPARRFRVVLLAIAAAAAVGGAIALLLPLGREPTAPPTTIASPPTPSPPPPPEPASAPASAPAPALAPVSASASAPSSASPPPASPRPRRPGFLNLDSKPYATIFIDGQKKGITPLVRLPLAPGPHRVRAVSSAGGERVFTVKVKSGQDLPARILTW